MLDGLFAANHPVQRGCLFFGTAFLFFNNPPFDMEIFYLQIFKLEEFL